MQELCALTSFFTRKLPKLQTVLGNSKPKTIQFLIGNTH